MNSTAGIRLLIATDNHLGYLERDPVRSEDSFRAFEEILQIAKSLRVDALLLGGDLFHDNKPSRKTLHRTMQLLRHYCYGEDPCQLQILSDQSVNFPSNPNYCVNYEDPNINVCLPVFSIHGNHDDPAGDGNLCSLELLSAAGFVNYFGRSMDVDNVTVSPVLLRKGETWLSLYGMGNIRDERLHRAFEKGKVKVLRPSVDTEKWFNLFVIHQNRVPHGHKNFIPESFLDQFIDLVLWGHEHECIIEPAYNPEQDFYVTQPGSSVATSLSEGESKTKHVGLLTINEKNFELEKIRLKTVRPFVISEVSLRTSIPFTNREKDVRLFLEQKVETLIDEAIGNWCVENEVNADDPEAKIPLPMVRLKVEYGTDGAENPDYVTFNPQRFGQAFVNRVANPKDILLFYRKRTPAQIGANGQRVRRAEMAKPEIPDKLSSLQVETLVNEYLSAQNLIALPETELGDAVRTFVEKDEKDAIKDFFQKSLKQTREKLKDKKELVANEQIVDEIEAEKKLRVARYLADHGCDIDVEEFENLTPPNVPEQQSHTRVEDDEADPNGPSDSSESDALSITDEVPRPRNISRARMGLTDIAKSKPATSTTSKPRAPRANAKSTTKAPPKKKQAKQPVEEDESSGSDFIDLSESDDGQNVRMTSDEELVPESEEEELKPPAKRKAAASRGSKGTRAAPKKSEPKQQSKLNFGKTAATPTSAASSRWPPRRGGAS